ncbi:MAG: LacI family DNA-binding transcriptional regulator [Opitutaceae bacterium]|jgi:LacI family transcriptional regulator
MARLPTIKDVASAAGVHFTTVSMALRGDPRLRPETRDRIFEAVARVGYRRNPVSESLSQRRSSGNAVAIAPRIAYLANRSPEEGMLKFAHYRLMIHGAREQAEAFGYGFEALFVDSGYHDSQSLYRYLKENAIKGVIIGAFEPTRRTLELPWEEFCVVKIDSRHMSPAATFVSNDQMQYVRLAFQKLRALSYRRIGLAIGVNDELGTGGLHTCGLLLEQSSIDRDQQVEPLFFPPEASDSDVAQMLGSWIKKGSVDAVISNSMSIRRLLGSSGARCPEDVACASVCMSQKTPSLAGVVANLDMIGRQVTGSLIALLRAEKHGIPESPTSTYVQGNWHDATSAPRRT